MYDNTRSFFGAANGVQEVRRLSKGGKGQVCPTVDILRGFHNSGCTLWVALGLSYKICIVGVGFLSVGPGSVQY